MFEEVKDYKSFCKEYYFTESSDRAQREFQRYQDRRENPFDLLRLFQSNKPIRLNSFRGNLLDQKSKEEIAKKIMPSTYAQVFEINNEYIVCTHFSVRSFDALDIFEEALWEFSLDERLCILDDLKRFDRKRFFHEVEVIENNILEEKGE